MADRKYATLEHCPCIIIHREAWALFDEKTGWVQIPLAEAIHEARLLTKAQFDQLFSRLPPMPETAFRSGETIQ